MWWNLGKNITIGSSFAKKRQFIQLQKTTSAGIGTLIFVIKSGPSAGQLLTLREQDRYFKPFRRLILKGNHITF
jgi:hypothetical protein